VEAGERGCPLLQQVDKLVPGDKRPRLMIEQIGDADAVKRRPQRHIRLVDRQRTVDRGFQRFVATFKLPMIEAAIGWPTAR